MHDLLRVGWDVELYSLIPFLVEASYGREVKVNGKGITLSYIAPQVTTAAAEARYVTDRIGVQPMGPS